MIRNFANGALALFACLALLLSCGCKNESKEISAESQVVDVATDQAESTTDAPKSEASERAESNATEPNATESNAVASPDVAAALGSATSRFSSVFSDGEEESNERADGEKESFDMTLVDDDVKRKYSDDRTLITPTLSSNEGESQGPKYRLAYRFEPNSSLSWNVSHLVRKRTSYGGKESFVETSSSTLRRWELLDVQSDGKVAARHWIDRMILRQNEEGKEPVEYDSERDVVVPKEISAFGTEKAVGVALENFCVDPLGVLSDKKRLVAEYQGREGDSNVIVPFPSEEVAVGDVWTIPYSLYLKGTDKTIRPYRVVERFRLESVDDKYATISFKTTLVSIVDDPVVEGELAERLFSGRALFDRELGLTVRTEMTFEKTVPGAYGFSSFLEYSCQVVEKLVRDDEKNANTDDVSSNDEASKTETL